MAKRFTDTNKYKKPFIRSLQGAYKLLWDFLYHDCDHAGIWIVDFEIAQAYLGSDMPVNKVDALKFFNTDGDRVIELEAGKKWFIPSFIEFQYGKLSEKNRAHLSAIATLKRFNLLNADLSVKNSEGGSEGLASPLQGAMEMDMDKDMEKDKEGGAGETNPELLLPTMLKQFTEANQHYPVDQMLDLPSMRLIAGKIQSWLGLKGQITDEANRDAITRRWGEMIAYVKSDQHLSGYDISKINKYFQTIAQGLFGKNGTSINQHRDLKPDRNTGRNQLLESLRTDVNPGGKQHTGC
ncbi:hypothetical protein [Paraflavitalea pollutisoli]|uniref:hypothetical protein n=1 Tax=Paraflavitalea pollutisoli TaxID=3034143 RepID=UPI0023EDF535|nr:hypothetical protein [Paraflavitalea sp. H1-2-19X]